MRNRHCKVRRPCVPAGTEPPAATCRRRRTCRRHSPSLSFAPKQQAPTRTRRHLQEEYDLDQKIDTGKLIDSEGAGRSMFSPGWLTQLNQLWGGKSVGAALDRSRVAGWSKCWPEPQEKRTEFGKL